MTGTEFVAQLMAENEELLAKIDAPAESRPVGSERSDPRSFDTLATLMKMALKNEMEAAEIAAEWVATTRELDAKVALACHAGDEARTTKWWKHVPAQWPYRSTVFIRSIHQARC